MDVNIQDIDAITLGNGILEMGGVNLGQLKDAVELQPKISWLDFKAGVPRRLVKRFLLEEEATIKASMAELSAANFNTLSSNATEAIIAAGQSSNMTKNVTLSGAVLWTIVNSAGISTGTVAVKNVAGVVTYTEDVDYVIDYAGGNIRRTSASTIVDGEAVVVTYKIDNVSAKRYYHGGKTAISYLPMTFTHYKPNGKYIKVYFYNAILESGFPLKFEEDKVSLQQVTITAVADTTQPVGQQLYYIEFEQ